MGHFRTEDFSLKTLEMGIKRVYFPLYPTLICTCTAQQVGISHLKINEMTNVFYSLKRVLISSFFILWAQERASKQEKTFLW